MKWPKIATLLSLGLVAQIAVGEVYPQWDKLPFFDKLSTTNIIRRISWKYYQKKKYPQALKVLNFGLNSSTGEMAYELQLTKARLLAELGRLEEAKEILTPYLQRNEKRPELSKTLAMIYKIQGRFQEAKTALQKSWDEEDWHMHYLMSELHLLTQDYKKAGVALDQMLQKFNSNPKGLLLKAQLLMAQKNYKGVQDLLTPMSNKFAGDFDVNFLLARATLNLGQFEEALKHLDKINPSDDEQKSSSIKLTQVELLLETGSIEKAEELINSMGGVTETESQQFARNFFLGKLAALSRNKPLAHRSFVRAFETLVVDPEKKRHVASHHELIEQLPAPADWGKESLQGLIEAIYLSKGKEKKYAPALCEMHFLIGNFSLAHFYKSWGQINENEFKLPDPNVKNQKTPRPNS